MREGPAGDRAGIVLQAPASSAFARSVISASTRPVAARSSAGSDSSSFAAVNSSTAQGEAAGFEEFVLGLAEFVLPAGRAVGRAEPPPVRRVASSAELVARVGTAAAAIYRTWANTAATVDFPAPVKPANWTTLMGAYRRPAARRGQGRA